MSRYFAQAEYAEDQQLARTILTTHVLHRGIQTGAVIGLGTGSATYLYKVLRSDVQLRAAFNSGHLVSTLRNAVHPTFSQTLFRHSGAGAIVGLAAMSLGLPVMMSGKEEIEWKDRAWRLMQNQGQLEVDDFSLVGGFSGAVSSFVTRRGGGLRQVVGRTAVGSVVGVLGYMGYRYGIMKGARTETSVRSSEVPILAAS